MSETEPESESEPERDDAGDERRQSLEEFEELEALVAENPDEVARFLDRLGVVNDLLDTADLATAAMDDRMVQELSGTATNLGAAADGLATEEVARLGEATGENAEDLADGLETLARLQRSGTLDDLTAMADLAALASNAMDDDMVTDLVATGTSLGEVADTAADEDVSRTLRALLEAVGEASTDPPEPVGFRGLVRSLRDLNVRRGLGFAISVVREVGTRLGREPGR